MTDVSIRRADFMMVLVYASDLATGHSRDFALKSCVLSMRIAELAGVSDEVRRNAYHQSMLRYVGCNADTDLLSATFGDEIALRQDLVGLDMGNRAELGRVFVQAFKRFYKVADVDHFIRIFSTKGADKRRLHGSKGATVFRDPSEPDRVWAIFDWDAEGWKNFVSDPEVPAILQEAGHVGKPQAALLLGHYEA
ncbi:hypothetical protein [Rhizobium yanglingense]